MADYPTGQERLLRQLISTFRCQVCHRTYDGNRARVAARQDELWIVSVRCSRCRNRQVFGVTMADEDAELEEDMAESEEQVQFAATDPLTPDDVLDMHLFLADFNGDFALLFGD